jgi:PKD repeat protein
MYRLAARLRTHLHDRTRGQSLVEFALVLPILMMLTLTALDFGRVYLGYINLQNMARIAANFAANNPDAWTASADPAVTAAHQATQLRYKNQILGDAAATNCNLPTSAGAPVVPIPTFKLANGSTTTTPKIGDTAMVGISCTFGVITPVIANIVGGSIPVSAASTFPVKTGMTASGPAVVLGSAPNAAFTGNAVNAPSSLTGTAPFTVVFRDTSGGNPTAWLWTFNDGSIPGTSTAQDPLGHAFIAPGTYLVTMTASNTWGSTTTSQGITVTSPTAVDFTMNQSSGNAPLPVNFTDASSPGGTNYAWTFGAGEGNASGAALKTTSHTYSTNGTFTVTLTVTYPTGPVSVTKTVSVSSSLCTVPNFKNTKRNDADGTWSAAHFTGTLTDGPGPIPNGNANYTITSQTTTGASLVPCNTNIQVNG